MADGAHSIWAHTNPSAAYTTFEALSARLGKAETLGGTCHMHTCSQPLRCRSSACGVGAPGLGTVARCNRNLQALATFGIDAAMSSLSGSVPRATS